MLPESIRYCLFEKHRINITDVKPLSGGSINQAFKIITETTEYFIKWNATPPDGFFEKEALGLELLRSANSGIRIPEVITFEHSAKNLQGFLLMEWVGKGVASAENFRQFGEKLARLHQKKAEKFGLGYDNYIGTLPQRNSFHSDWISFFVEERISPQLKRAIDSGKIHIKFQKNWQRMAGQLDDLFPKCKPSLLHGDLWGGNYHFDADGLPVLIDPAVYYGHPEMDLAFSKMFGGFSEEFYKGYETVSPLEPGFSNRIDIFNFYPLLVHVNLFGSSYSWQAQNFLKSF